MGGFFGGGASVDLASPPAIGNTTPNTGKFTTLEATTSLQVSTSGFVFGGTNLLEQRNSTSAQTFRIYNTFTDSSNYERGFMRWNSNILEIGHEVAGTGTNRDVRIITRTQNNHVALVGCCRPHLHRTRERRSEYHLRGFAPRILRAFFSR